MNVKRLDRSGHPAGFAMLLVLMAVMIATVLAMSFLASQGTSTGIAQNINHNAVARGIAESGLEMAMRHIHANSEWRSTFPNGLWMADVPLGAGTFSVWGQDEDGDLTDDLADAVTITVVGKYKGVTHVVRTVVTPGETSDPLNNLLYVVNNAGSLTATEMLHVARFEEWGYLVRTISASASQSAFNSAVADNDVVYIDESINPTTLGTKLVGVTKGIVCEEAGQYDEFGYAASSAAVTSNKIDITDNSHHITAVFPLGDLVILDASGDLVRASGSLASSAMVIGKQSGGSSSMLATIEAGGALVDGSAAAGRRAFLPLAGSANTFAKLNDNGLTIVQRSLEWVAQPPKGPPALAHWKLDETSGIIAKDSSAGKHHGLVYNGAKWSLGKLVGALLNDGNDDYVEIPNHPDFMVTNALSITAWIKASSFNSGSDVDVILRKGEGNPNNWQLCIADGKVTLQLDTSDGSGPKGSTTLATNQWYHVAATWDGSKIRLYVNGQIDNGSGANKSAPIGTDSRPIYLSGRAGAAGNDRFNGLVDDVRFYNRALSAAEIRVLYEEGDKAGKLPRLVSCYNFDEVKPQPAAIAHWKLDESGSGGGGAVALNYVYVYSLARIDSYDSSAGAYDLADNSGRDARVAVVSTSSSRFNMDTSSSLFGHAYCGAGGNPSTVIVAHEGCISGQRVAMASNPSIPDQGAPTGFPASEGNKSYSTNQTWNSDRRFGNLTLSSSAVVTVQGARRIWCDGTFTIQDSAKIVLAPGASLTLYTNGATLIRDNAQVNNDSTRCADLTLIQYHNTADLTIQNSAVFAGVIQADYRVVIQNSAEFFGSIVARDRITINHTALVHLDINLPSVGIADSPAVEQVLSNTGTFVNGAAGGQSGAKPWSGNSVYFDGSNDRIDLPHHDAYLLRAGAVAFWFKPDNVGGVKGMFSKDCTGYATGGGLTIDLNGAQVRARFKSNNTTYTLTSSNVANSTWHHAAFVWGPYGCALYVNGELADSNAYVGGLGTSSGGSGNYQPIAIGASRAAATSMSASGINQFFKGYIDDVRIYHDALDAAQVVQVMNNQTPGASSLPGAMVVDTGTVGGALNLPIDDVSKVQWQSGGGLKINSALSLVSEDVALKLYDAMTQTNEFSFEVKFKPANLTQTGPARIVSMETSLSALNFAVGQSAGKYSLRARTTTTGNAGTPQIDSSNVLSTSNTDHIIFSYDGTNVIIRRNGEEDLVVARAGALSNWSSVMKLALASDPSGGSPWLGTLYRVAIYDRSFNTLQANNVFAGLPPGDGLSKKPPKFRWAE